MRRPGGIRIIEERELIAVRAALKLLQPDDPPRRVVPAAGSPEAAARIRSGAGRE